VETRAFLRNTHLNRAGALMQLDRHADALPHLDRALELDDGRFNHMCRLARAQVHAHLKQNARATAEANSLLAEMRGEHPGLLHGTACVFALSAAAVAPDDPLAEGYAARAVALLRRARDAGYEGTERWRTARDLKSVSARNDFNRLLAEGDLRK
jgi:hypothetical protein